ncbi:hypothetical protein P3T32_001696 [Ralstonia sp. GP73]|jgi:hypothetical protein|uniref:Chemotaxis protein n=3 Tax=Pseudomonadota TaxID=1224 RepID=A0AAD2BMC8_9RALS|nr:MULTISPECIES: hypothetical protein [Ralstonia]MBT2179264.1 hypothetical protein [Ralstonia pickettii]MDH6641860.1 hypothetical protein [Ralstonia sp. GP73]OCS46322.1 hypothetical protein BEK68_02640 [Ralstonia pickettii]CAJ0712860.1 hypothetical protein LMG7143_02505 [Ralstonia sp. LMG 18095]CAJ0787642.1 hypothetical protein R77560_01606 [Ralstonia sp. LMG 18095]
MATSNLYRTGEAPAQTGKGHGTDALGPSDSSDSGSDVVGGPGLGSDVEDRFDDDPAVHPHGNAANRTAGADLGDVNLDSDTDSTGTGERRAAGHEPVIREGGDLMPDAIRDVHDPEVDTPIDDENFEHATGLAGENDDADAPDAVELDEAPIDPQPGSRDVPVQSPTGGGTDWSDNMRRSRPTYKGKRVPGQHRS